MRDPQNKLPSRFQNVILRILIICGILSIINFFLWFLKEELIDNELLFYLLLSVLVFDSFRLLYIWYHYWDMSMPVKPGKKADYTVDVFTTYVPGEPMEMLHRTLLAIKNISYPHQTVLCDESNDDRFDNFCRENKIIHIKRVNKVDAKAGNINNALKQTSGEICVILDPDHVPETNFIDEILPFFQDKSIGFVQTVQGYYNNHESSVAKGAADQTFQFYGPVMKTMNSYGTVNAIGANCVFRREALNSIGGHASGLSEDMHTAMQLHAKGWKSVYYPLILTQGLVPATLQSYFKQQLKWSRGTMELLVSVFPKLYNKFSWRQKIHYGILPFHYLVGFMFLFTFLIPIIALLNSTTPWKGNINNFITFTLPVIASIIGIRIYVQNWLISEKERGLHLIGGILLQCSWWIYILGVLYTILRKKVPYIPTNKKDLHRTPFIIVFPNLLLGLLSLFSIIYGLSRDFTPFSILMSGFALWNAIIMFFTLEFAYGKKRVIEFVSKPPKYGYTILPHNRFIRKTLNLFILPLLISLLALSSYIQFRTVRLINEGVIKQFTNSQSIKYLGVFSPNEDSGITDLELLKEFEYVMDEKVNIASYYLSWPNSLSSTLPESAYETIFRNNMIPLITWEPWIDMDSTSQKDFHLFDRILNGDFDAYIDEFASDLITMQRPVFLRFAHEFDNSFYPWYNDADDANLKFKTTWRYIFNRFRRLGAENVIWVWNPWRAEVIEKYYPGDDYVDWIGVDILDYNFEEFPKEWNSFKYLFDPFHNELIYNSKKPVMICEFGTLKKGDEKREWLENAMKVLAEGFFEIKGLVYFQSKFDNNLIENESETEVYDWTIQKVQAPDLGFKRKNVPNYITDYIKDNVRDDRIKPPRLSIPSFIKDNLRGINIKKGHDWQTDFHVLNRQNLEKDFRNFKELDINSIKFKSNETYDYNLISISKEYGFNISYGFYIPPNTDFLSDSLLAREIRDNILDKIKKNTSQNPIIAWTIDNDILTEMATYFNKPQLFYQKRAYLIWLNDLLKEIKKIDSNRPIIVSIAADINGSQHARLISNYVDNWDAFGLTVFSENDRQKLVGFLEQSNYDYLYSDINVQDLHRLSLSHDTKSSYISSYQDEYQSNQLSFKGIIDRKGRKKPEFNILKNLYSTSEEGNQLVDDIDIRILRPSTYILEGQTATYHALQFKEDTGWSVIKNNSDIEIEWSLISCDRYGNYLGIKEVGNSPVLKLKIPQDIRLYKLHLTVIYEGKAFTAINTLFTPFNN